MPTVNNLVNKPVLLSKCGEWLDGLPTSDGTSPLRRQGPLQTAKQKSLPTVLLLRFQSPVIAALCEEASATKRHNVMSGTAYPATDHRRLTLPSAEGDARAPPKNLIKRKLDCNNNGNRIC